MTDEINKNIQKKNETKTKFIWKKKKTFNATNSKIFFSVYFRIHQCDCKSIDDVILFI